MFDKKQFIFGYLLAQNAKKKLEDEGADLPKNFAMKHSLLYSMVPQSLGAIVIQNEEHKKSTERFDLLKTEKTIFENEIGSFCNKIASGKELTSVEKIKEHLQQNPILKKYYMP